MTFRAWSVQHEVWHAGRFIARVDAALAELRLAIEVDGFEHHSSPDAFQRDRTRQNRLVALGWTVLRFTWDGRREAPGDGGPDDPRCQSGVSPPPDRLLCAAAAAYRC